MVDISFGEFEEHVKKGDAKEWLKALKAKTDGDLISRQDVVNEIHKYFVEEIDKTPTEIDEDGDELYADMRTVNSLLACNKELSKRIKSLPSAEPKTGECTGCKFIGLYDTEFPCVNCVRKTKDYYCRARMKGADDE